MTALTSNERRLKRARRLLGVVPLPSGAGWSVSEVRRAGSATDVTRTTTLELDGADALDPAAVGERLAAHLKAEGYAARDVVWGLPNKSLFVRSCPLPPTPDAAQRFGLLRLRVEKDHADRRLTFDALDAGGDAALLVGAPTQAVQRCVAAAAAAGLRLRGVTSVGLADPADPVADGAWRSEDADGVDLTVRRGGAVAALTRLPAGPAGAAQGAALADGLTVHPAAADPAAAVAAAMLTRPESMPDFLAGRLYTVQAGAGGGARRRLVMAAAAGLLLVLAAGGWAWSRSAQIQALEDDFAEVRAPAVELQRVRDRTAAAAPWFTGRPDPIAALAAVSACFPESGRIWVTGLRLDAEGVGSLKCRADRKDTMLACLNALRVRDDLAGVQLRDWNEADRNSGVVGFEIGFTYHPGGPAGGAKGGEG